MQFGSAITIINLIITMSSRHLKITNASTYISNSIISGDTGNCRLLETHSITSTSSKMLIQCHYSIKKGKVFPLQVWLWPRGWVEV